MTKTEMKKKASDVAAALAQLYPDAECALSWQGDPWRLLIMSRLSAQCTDKKVNTVSVSLFERFPTPKSMAEAELSDIEEIIRPCGLYRMKAKNLRDSSRMLLEDFGGQLPSDMDALLSLPGVGRKIANLLRGDVFGYGGIVTDTHFIRICGRLGFYPESEKSPQRIERIFTPLLPTEEQSDFCHRIVMFGREICKAQSPECEACPLSKLGLCKKACSTIMTAQKPSALR